MSSAPVTIMSRATPPVHSCASNSAMRWRAAMSRRISSKHPWKLTSLLSNSEMELRPFEVPSADVTQADRTRSPAPHRTGSVRGLTRRSFHRIAFTDWGPESAACPVLCVHGLTRNGRDFDHLAAALSDQGRRVVCPDLPGRGQSERLKDRGDY